MVWVAAIATAVVVLVTAGCLIALARVQEHVRVYVREGTNADDSAKETFLSLVCSARGDVVVHDDGDGSRGSMYKDREVLARLEACLTAQPELRMRFLFNENAELPLAVLAKAYPGRVLIRYTHVRPEHDVHYKIVDGGRRACLSVHRRGDRARRWKSYDCTEAGEKTRNRLFGDIYAAFEREFQAASVA